MVQVTSGAKTRLRDSVSVAIVEVETVADRVQGLRAALQEFIDSDVSRRTEGWGFAPVEVGPGRLVVVFDVFTIGRSSRSSLLSRLVERLDTFEAPVTVDVCGRPDDAAGREQHVVRFEAHASSRLSRSPSGDAGFWVEDVVRMWCESEVALWSGSVSCVKVTSVHTAVEVAKAVVSAGGHPSVYGEGGTQVYFDPNAVMLGVACPPHDPERAWSRFVDIVQGLQPHPVSAFAVPVRRLLDAEGGYPTTQDIEQYDVVLGVADDYVVDVFPRQLLTSGHRSKLAGSMIEDLLVERNPGLWELSLGSLGEPWPPSPEALVNWRQSLAPLILSRGAVDPITGQVSIGDDGTSPGPGTGQAEQGRWDAVYSEDSDERPRRFAYGHKGMTLLFVPRSGTGSLGSSGHYDVYRLPVEEVLAANDVWDVPLDSAELVGRLSDDAFEFDEHGRLNLTVFDHLEL